MVRSKEEELEYIISIEICKVAKKRGRWKGEFGKVKGEEEERGLLIKRGMEVVIKKVNEGCDCFSLGGFDCKRSHRPLDDGHVSRSYGLVWEKCRQVSWLEEAESACRVAGRLAEWLGIESMKHFLPMTKLSLYFGFGFWWLDKKKMDEFLFWESLFFFFFPLALSLLKL